MEAWFDETIDSVFMLIDEQLKLLCRTYSIKVVASSIDPAGYLVD